MSLGGKISGGRGRPPEMELLCHGDLLCSHTIYPDLTKTYLDGFYSARNARIASAVLATAIPSVYPSVRPSVRLSVTRRYCVKTTARSTVQFASLDSKMCLVL